MSFALQLDGKSSEANLETAWVDPNSVSDEEKLNSLILKQTLGVSTEQLLSEAGYGAQDVKRMLAEKQAAVEAAQKQFDTGHTGGGF